LKNRMKFISLWKAAQKLEAKLFLVNYTKKGTTHEDKVLMQISGTLEHLKRKHLNTNYGNT
ncbi:MAG TPA: hypothetical protein PKI15_10470, partial [Candidatus Cloacimonadota bacterium]|nr:hypothetical protein [Candidatus Cloacimonadota bacterium]